jgi:uncharacterized membrane protein YeaQ/YmgE (transglycosylase-associated protein family)
VVDVVETGVIAVMLLWWIVVGLLVGAVARFLVPGRDQMGCLGTILLGVAGSFVGGFLWELIQFHRVELHPIGFIGSVVGAVVLLLLRRLVIAR